MRKREKQICQGATSVTPVVLAAGDGRQFTTPGYDGSTGYGKQAKCLWTFAPATGATLTFSCSTFDLTATSAVGDKCTGADYFANHDHVGDDLLIRGLHESVRPGRWEQPRQQWRALLPHDWAGLHLLLANPGALQHKQRRQCRCWL